MKWGCLESNFLYYNLQDRSTTSLLKLRVLENLGDFVCLRIGTQSYGIGSYTCFLGIGSEFRKFSAYETLIGGFALLEKLIPYSLQSIALELFWENGKKFRLKLIG